MTEDNILVHTSEAVAEDNGGLGDDTISPLGLETIAGVEDDKGDDSHSSSDDSSSRLLVHR